MDILWVLSELNQNALAGLIQQVWDSLGQFGTERYLQLCAARWHALDDRLQKHAGQWHYTIRWRLLQC